MLLQPLVLLLQPPKAAPDVLPAPASRGRLCCCRGLTAPYYSHRWPGPAATAASHRSRTSEPSYSSPRAHPLPHLPQLRVVPFLGLAVVQTTSLVLSARHGQRCQRPTSIGRVLYVVRPTAGSRRPRKCLLITRKIIIPPPDSRDPPDGPPYLAKKTFPLTAGTHRTGQRISRKNVPPTVSSDPPEVPSYYAQKMNTPPASWDPP